MPFKSSSCNPFCTHFVHPSDVGGQFYRESAVTVNGHPRKSVHFSPLPLYELGSSLSSEIWIEISTNPWSLLEFIVHNW